MAKTDGPKDEKKEPVKNLHIDVPESFHRRVKMMCVMQGVRALPSRQNSLEGG